MPTQCLNSGKEGKVVNKISTLLEKLTNIALILLMLLLTVSTTLQVVTRFITKSPLVWTEEVSRMSFIWIALLGSTLATKHSEHLSLDFIVDKFPKTLRNIVRILVHLMMMTVATLFIVAGWEFVGKNATRISETTGISMVYLYIAAPVSGVLMLFYLIEQIPGLINMMKKNSESFNVSGQPSGKGL